MVVKHEPSICLSPTYKRASMHQLRKAEKTPVGTLPFFPAVHLESCRRKHMFFWGFFGSSLFVRDSPKLNIYQLSSGKVNLWPSQPLVDLHQGRAGKHGPSTNDATFKIWVLREVCEGECMEDELLGKGDVVCGSPSSSSDLCQELGLSCKLCMPEIMFLDSYTCL